MSLDRRWRHADRDIQTFKSLLLPSNSKYYLSSEDTFEQWALTKYVFFRHGVPGLSVKVMAAASPSWRLLASDIRLFHLTFADVFIIFIAVR